MKLDGLRIYYNAVVGAAGGLIGWAVITLLLRIETDSTFLLLLKDAVLGVMVGAAVGFALGSAEQLGGGLRLGSLGKPILSALLGMVAGLIGLVTGELIFLAAGGGVWPRALGWAVFGTLVGAGQWVVTGSPNKGLYGAIGGLLGGLMGGATYERFSLVLRGIGLDREISLALGGAIGLMILGACIGALIGLVEDILRQAWLRFTHGPLEGQTRTLDPKRSVTTLGRADHCTILLRDERETAPVHAEIHASKGVFTLVPREGRVLLRDGREGRPITVRALQPGDEIQLGRSRFVFQTEESA
jgi:CDP-diglyceride synthetase